MKCKHCDGDAIAISNNGYEFGEPKEDVYFCSACQRGWSVYEYDASQNFVEYRKREEVDLEKRISLQRAGLVASFLPIESPLLDFGYDKGPDENRKFDAVTFFGSLEYVPVEKTLQSIPLAEGGYIFITVRELPLCFTHTRDVNYLSKVFADWKHAEPKGYLEYFTQQGLERVLEDLKFKVVHVTHQESFLRFDPKNPQRNILTIVAQKCS